MMVKMSVAYGNQRAGVRGVELSLGEVTHSGNMLCERKADSIVKLAGGAAGCPVSAFSPETSTALRCEAPAR
jgi:hypothetical protein